MVITRVEDAEQVARSIISRFDRGIPAYYDPEDSRCGFVIAPNRKGEIAQHGIMTVSVAVVLKPADASISHIRMSEVAAETKLRLKQMPGSVYSVVKVMHEHRVC